MQRLLARPKHLIATVAVTALLTSGCTVVFTGGGGGGSCLVGTWELSGEEVAGVIQTAFGGLSVDPDPNGLTLTIDGDGTYDFSGTQTLTVSGSTPWGTISGTATATISVAGTWQDLGGNEVEFTVDSLSGSLSFDGTLNGAPFSTTIDVAGGGFDDLWSLEGTASYTCSGGTLTLDFTDIHFDF